MIDNSEWIKKQCIESEIKENYDCLQKVKASAIEKLDEYFEFVVDRLFMSLGNFRKIEAYMTLDSEMKPKKVADGNNLETFGRDCFVSYDEFDLVIEATRRPLFETALHWSHLEKEPKVKQFGIIIFQDIDNIDSNIWVQNKAQFSVDGRFFHLCEADFIFKLLKNSSTSFSKFKEFLKDSKSIWEKESDYEAIRQKIITLVRPEK